MKPLPAAHSISRPRPQALRFSLSALPALLAAVLVLLSGASTSFAQSLFVASQAGATGTVDGVLQFDPSTGSREKIFNSGTAVGIAFGPTGDLFVADFQGRVVKRLDGTTGEVSSILPAAGLSRPLGAASSPGGDIFISDDDGVGKVVRYDGRTGVSRGVFATGGTNLWHITFGPDGDLYVCSAGTGQVLRFNGTTGASKGVFADAPELTSAYGLSFGPDGDLYVSSGPPPTGGTGDPHQPILRFNGTTGAFKGEFTSGHQLNNPDAVLFGPDGDLYVSDYSNNQVARFDGTTGVFKSIAATGGGLSGVSGLAFTPAAKMLNISTRLRVQTGDNVLIGGFIITGDESKRVMLRAIGPSLNNAGVSGALANPRLELHNSAGAVIGTNDNWRVTEIGGVIIADQEAAIEATGIPPANDNESAIIATLRPGAYTAVMQGVNSGTGIGLVEAYDLNQVTPSKLANISTRGFVEGGDDVMIGGFIVQPGGGTETSVVVRAIGPSLQPDISDALEDPTLELHDGDGATVAENDDWKDSQQTAIENSGLAPTNDAESAIVASLQPGPYTAIVRGKDSTTGVALVELYDLN